MTEAAATKKTRRSPQEIKEQLAQKIAAIDNAEAAKTKERLSKLQAEAQALAVKGSGKPWAQKAAQAASLLGAAAQEIKVMEA